MRAWFSQAVRALAIASVAWFIASTLTGVALRGAPAPMQAEAPPVAEFHKRVEAYIALHRKVDDSIKALPNDATPQQIDAALEQLSSGIVAARPNAKPSDIFQPEMQAWLRQTLQRAFSGPDGKDLRASILDENPIGATVRVNGPYPDSIPLSTMPPKVLEVLPKLPEELEFRFIGDRLILFDHHAHLIVDYVDRALPVV